MKPIRAMPHKALVTWTQLAQQFEAPTQAESCEGISCTTRAALRCRVSAGRARGRVYSAAFPSGEGAGEHLGQPGDQFLQDLFIEHRDFATTDRADGSRIGCRYRGPPHIRCMPLT